MRFTSSLYTCTLLLSLINKCYGFSSVTSRRSFLQTNKIGRINENNNVLMMAAKNASEISHNNVDAFKTGTDASRFIDDRDVCI